LKGPQLVSTKLEKVGKENQEHLENFCKNIINGADGIDEEIKKTLIPYDRNLEEIPELKEFIVLMGYTNNFIFDQANQKILKAEPYTFIITAFNKLYEKHLQNYDPSSIENKIVQLRFWKKL